MNPVTPHAHPLDLTAYYTIDRAELTGDLRPLADGSYSYGAQIWRGFPFLLGNTGSPNVILLDETAIHISLGGLKANYLLFAHVVEDRLTNYQPGLADSEADGNELGHHVSDYTLIYEDGSQVTTPIQRRFAIQQSRVGWGASAFMAVPALGPEIFNTVTEEFTASRPVSREYGQGEARVDAGRDRSREHIWLY
ncbi:MAG: hypothetical protein KDE59_28585, partial [Anaerolineales bacterium]|nr:hypothetical protein [Anaerolineales bacterium]